MNRFNQDSWCDFRLEAALTHCLAHFFQLYLYKSSNRTIVSLVGNAGKQVQVPEKASKTLKLDSKLSY